jgi:hypothetical protein
MDIVVPLFERVVPRPAIVMVPGGLDSRVLMTPNPLRTRSERPTKVAVDDFSLHGFAGARRRRDPQETRGHQPLGGAGPAVRPRRPSDAQSAWSLTAR